MGQARWKVIVPTDNKLDNKFCCISGIYGTGNVAGIYFIRIEGEILDMANKKEVKFTTKIFHENKVYLTLSDVTKVLNYPTKQSFIDAHSDVIIKIKGIGDCILETDYNGLLVKDDKALSKQKHMEITKVDTLRSKIDMVIGMYPLKLAFGKGYFEMMARKHGCMSIEEYILKYDLPEEEQKCLKEIQEHRESNTYYKEEVNALYDKSRLDIDKLRQCGLDVQVMTQVTSDGHMSLISYIVGEGVFLEFSSYEYHEWDKISVDENGNILVPYFNYDDHPEDGERLINLSDVSIDRDFRSHSVVENLAWCIENLKVEPLEDYEYDVFHYHSDTIDFEVGIELLVKMIKQDSSNTVYVDGIVVCEEDVYITDIDGQEVFAR